MPFQNNYIESTPKSFKKNRHSSITEEAYNLKELLALNDEITLLKQEVEQKNNVILDLQSQIKNDTTNELETKVKELEKELKQQINENEKYKCENTELMQEVIKLEEICDSINAQLNKDNIDLNDKDAPMDVDNANYISLYKELIQAQETKIIELNDKLNEYQNNDNYK